MRTARRMRHGELDSLVLECKDTGHRGSGAAPGWVDAARAWGDADHTTLHPETPVPKLVPVQGPGHARRRSHINPCHGHHRLDSR